MKTSESVWIEDYKGKRGTTYRVRWRKPDGTRGATKPFKTWRLAFEDMGRKRAELEAQAHGLPAPVRNETLATAIERYLKDAATYKKSNTVEHFDRPALKSFSAFAGVEPKNITVELVTEWKIRLMSPEAGNAKSDDGSYSPHTVRMYMRCLRTFLNYLNVPNNPVKAERMPKFEPVGRVLSEDEMEVAAGEVAFPRIGDAIRFAFYSGCRIGEIITLDFKHLKHDAGSVYAIVSGKTGERIILLNPKAAAAIGPLKEAGQVFPFTRDQMGGQLRRATERREIGRVRWHDFRHSFATHYMEETGDLFGLMAYGGWTSTTSMKIYQHITKGRSRAVLRLFVPKLPQTFENSPS
jgi:integrase